MERHFLFSDLEFEKQFESATLDPGLFSHEAHLRLAWIHIQRYGIEKALINIPKQIQNYVAKLGARDKYNETLTIASVKVVYHFTLRSKTHNFAIFIKESPRLKTAFKSLIETHYSFDVFQNGDAKRSFLEPDLVPFD